jgi:general secretion pathway protein M
MKDWLESLQPRERAFIVGGAVLVTVALIYAFAWVPLDKRQSTLAASVADWQRSVAELGALKNMPVTNESSPAAPDGGQTPVVIVDRTLRARGLDKALQRSQPTTSNGIRVEFKDVAFDDLALWLGDLSTQYAMEVTSGAFSAPGNGEPGRVDATLTLERTP